MDGPAVIQDDLANHCETETVSFGTRGEEGLEDAFEQRLVHAAPRVADRNDDIVARRQFAMIHRRRSSDLLRGDLNLDAAGCVHRLGRIVANIQNDLLDLRRLTRDDRLPRCRAHDEADSGTERCLQQRFCFGDERLDGDAAAPQGATTAERENLIDEVARPFARAPDLNQASRHPRVRS